MTLRIKRDVPLYYTLPPAERPTGDMITEEETVLFLFVNSGRFLLEANPSVATREDLFPCPRFESHGPEDQSSEVSVAIACLLAAADHARLDTDGLLAEGKRMFHEYKEGAHAAANAARGVQLSPRPQE
jgi:hypothetical protein